MQVALNQANAHPKESLASYSRGPGCEFLFTNMTLEGYLSKISDTTRTLGVGTYAFRGQGNAHWPLHSAATRRLRKHRGEGVQKSPEFSSLYLDYHTTTLIAPARTQGLGIEFGRKLSDLQLLAKLQHLRAATGLMDFTWNPLVGLWFGCEEPEVDGKLFVINVTDPIHVAMISEDESEQPVASLFDGKGELPNIAYWEPMASGDALARILRQRSVFVVGRPKIPEDSNIIPEIIIDQEDKNELIRELGLLDVSHKSLFLDAHGFAETNRVEYPVLLSQDDYLIAGNRYYQQGAFLQAIKTYGSFVDLNPDNYMIYFLRANAHAELHTHVEAIEDYDRAISTMVSFPRSVIINHMIYFNRANSKVERKDHKGALKDYLQAIELAHDPASYYINLANTYADIFCYEEAISAYDEVAPGNWHAMFNKGNALMCMGRFKEAQECYIQAVAQAPDNEQVKRNLWTSSRLLELLGGLKFTLHFDSSTMYLEICVAEKTSLPEPRRTYMIAGRTGNIGNSGFMNPGGHGFSGSGPVFIRISTHLVEQG